MMINNGAKIIRKIFLDRDGKLRPIYVIAIVLTALFILAGVIVDGVIDIMHNQLIASGDIKPAADYISPYVEWLNDQVLPILTQVIYDAIMITVPLVAWKIMKKPWGKIGLRPSPNGYRDGITGLLMGAVGISVIFCLLLLSGNATVASGIPHVSWNFLWWMLTFVMIAFAEELLNRGFLMSMLRWTKRKIWVMLAPAVFFGMLHIFNSNFGVIPMINIVLAGLVIGYMYLKTGSLWMCIGFHFTWNVFQGLIFGMPVSGITVSGLLSTEFSGNNIINGGGFGIEGGLLSTIVLLLTFVFLAWYFRNSRYDFIEDCVSPRTAYGEKTDSNC